MLRKKKQSPAELGELRITVDELPNGTLSIDLGAEELFLPPEQRAQLDELAKGICLIYKLDPENFQNNVVSILQPVYTWAEKAIDKKD